MTKLDAAYRFANMSLLWRLLIYFVLFFILPVMIIGFISYTLSFNVIRERAVQFSTQTVNQVGNEVDRVLLDAYRVADMIANDPTIQEPLRGPLEQDVAERFSTDLWIDTRLDFIRSYGRDFFGFYVIGKNGGKYKSNYCSMRRGDLSDTDWYRQIVSANGPVWFSTHTDSFAAETAGQSFVTVGLAIKDKATGEISGVVLVDIQEEQLTGVIQDSKLGKTGYMFVLDGNNRMILNPDRKITAKAVSKITQLSDAAGELTVDLGEGGASGKSIVLYKTSGLTGWKMTGVVPVSEITADSGTLGVILALMVFIICILAIVAALYTTRRVANPIRKLMLLMKRVEEGDLSVSMNVKYDDEIGKLGTSFNIMLKNIAGLMDRVYEEQKNLRKAELKALQAQINPHFLYNTLDSIVWMARANRNDDIIRMVTALTKLFRIGLSRGKDVISLKEELEHIQSYLTIQQIRYKSKFSYAVQVDEELFRYKTLKLILQPIVENAIYHGIKEKRGEGYVSITGRDCEEYILFSVQDNGVGMTQEQLEALENTLQNSDGEKMDSYGVKNVDERIKIFFGPEYGLTFCSEYQVGTTVQIKIPKVMEVEDVPKSSIG